MTAVNAEPLSLLRTRTSEKWTAYPPHVLPLFVAEMDYPLAAPVATAMIDRIRASDTGYVAGTGDLPAALARFAEQTWGWAIDEDGVRTTTDVSVAIVESLRLAIRPGDRVIITPPVYPPFFDLVPEAGGVVAEVPLLTEGGYALDLAGIEAAFAAGATAMLLCNPHNPLGLVHPRATLEALAELAARYGATIVSDEIHGPLVYETAAFTPFLTVSDAAREHTITVTSASKAFNLAGVKCAIFVAASARTKAMLERLPEEVGFRTSLLGLHASVAAFTDGGPWLAGVLESLDANRRLLAELLAEHLPGVRYSPPAASYLAWLDFREVGWGDDPGIRALEAGVALNSGPTFGTEGRGFARLNFACSPEVLTEAVERLARSS